MKAKSSNPKITIHPPESKVCFNLIINIATKTNFEYSASASQRAHKKATYCVIQSISIIINDFPKPILKLKPIRKRVLQFQRSPYLHFIPI